MTRIKDYDKYTIHMDHMDIITMDNEWNYGYIQQKQVMVCCVGIGLYLTSEYEIID